MELALLGLALLLLIMNAKLSKWLLGEQRVKISETEGEKVHRWVIFVSIFISLIILTTIIDRDNDSALMWFLLCVLIVMCSIQALMEWKYLKGTKQYVIPLLLMAISVFGVLVIFFIDDWMKHTTFQDVVSEQLHEETEVNSITIRINDLSERIPQTKARVTIEDKETIGRILEVFSEMELKQDDGLHEFRKYNVTIETTNQVAEDHFETKGLRVELDENYANISASSHGRYEIVSGTNHLQTIEELVESDEIDWERPNTD
ncbi:DUF4181 domain-containing protein [Lentibacillus sp. CBA3610]|uniref:DUF4181 domain-containing protein n=1 Tax=Lentibacillus sp. CBA3610 TaxID=2518176 RepID=UPI0015956102|nr:DUF4181 domain-containing protein [Lentibacillus sp. CBA3610]QKY70702.1 DUF4181 domain-containing protein [Lentibacillus sp. CBA3610]